MAKVNSFRGKRMAATHIQKAGKGYLQPPLRLPQLSPLLGESLSPHYGKVMAIPFPC